MTTVPKVTDGNFFEDFSRGQIFRHAIPRTITEGDLAVYIALTGDRRPLNCSSENSHTTCWSSTSSSDARCRTCR
jgi:2-methylfumaryl-CoA hydratase